MKFTLISLFVLIIGFFIPLQDIVAQSPVTLEAVYKKERIASRRPVPYQHLREADVMWSKTVWRQIELTEKINLPLYYPEEKPLDNERRKSLIQVILHGIFDTGEISAYDPSDATYEFKLPMTSTEIKKRFGAEDKTVPGTDPDTGEYTEVEVKGKIESKQVKKYILKELWFFDKQRSVMDVRIIGICPIRTYYYDTDTNYEEPQYKKTCWVFFPKARNLFARHEVFNPYNDADKLSFDDMFFKRFFSSHILKESNTFEDRWITDYAEGIESLLEAERIHNTIFHYEHDLWEF